MKLTEAYVVKLIKKSIKQFMCCCVGSEIGDGPPEGAARIGSIYIDNSDEDNPVLYYYNGTEWIALSSGGGDSVVNSWTTDSRPADPTIGLHGFNTQIGKFEVFQGEDWMLVEGDYSHITLIVNASTGNDGLTPFDYTINATPFQTLAGAINYAASSSATIIDITLETDAVYSNTTDFSSKKLTIECSGFNIALTKYMSFANSSVTMNGLGTMNIALGANIYLKDTSLTINGGTLQGADVTPLIVFGGVSHLNIGGTVYLETVENGVILNADSNTGETNISVSDGSIFYINSNAGEANVSLYSAYVNTIVNTIKTNSNISSLGFNNMNQDYNAIIIYNDCLQFNDNADAISNGVALGSVYKTPDGVLHQVLASVTPKLRTVIFEIDISDFNSIFPGDVVPYTIVSSDYEGVLGEGVSKSSDHTFGFDTVYIVVTPEILNFNIIMPTRIDNIKYIGYLHSESRLKIQGFETTNSSARLTSIDSAMGSIRATIQFLA